ncbi:hypothetical protein ILUMI_16433, partial [Ignelater luminosus]
LVLILLNSNTLHILHIFSGAKFGLMEIKIGLVRILSEFEVKRSADTPVPIEFETKCLLVASKVGLPMKFSRVTD